MAKPKIRDEIRFILNGEDVALSSIAPDETLLDYLRLRRSLRGTKEGCAEGDCGACTVLVGRLSAGKLVYESVNACIRFMGSLNGCHVVTVEHLRGTGEQLHPVQQAMVDFHGSQCGFCTPGFVMSLYALWMKSADPSDAAIEKALQGNLCRCTGYEAIMRAARAISSYGKVAKDPLAAERKAVTARLAAIADGSRIEIGKGESRLIVPADVDDFAKVLKDEPGATIVAGSTDVGLWVTKHMRAISPAIFIGNLDGLCGISEDKGVISIGAGVTYSDAFSMLAKRIPALGPLFDRIGGEQVRNMGTIGGNIANGSPIGDTPPPLIALGLKPDAEAWQEATDDPARGFFHRLWQAGPAAGRIRRGRACAGAGKRRSFRRPQDHQASRRGHHRGARRVPPDARQERHGRQRSASPMAAWRRRRSGQARSRPR